jgi:CheY-like chemotaxis protein
MRSHKPNEKSVRTEERRKKSRVLVSTPVRLRSLEDGAGSLEDTTTTVNLSATGILINSQNSAYHRGMKVRLILPYVAESAEPQAEQAGHVVRIVELPGGRRSIAVALDNRTDHAVNQKDDKTSQESTKPLVLVVESEIVASEFMKKYLSSEGYEVITVTTVKEAHGVLDQRTPSLLIAEIEGDEKPGFALCSHCKETPRLKRIPVMLMTSSAYPSDYAKAHSVGAVVCMAKPYKRERLGHVVKLLAPPPNANTETTPPHRADASRHAAAKRPKPSSRVSARR